MEIVIGITGASGVIMGERLLAALKQMKKITTHLVMTDSAKKTLELETELRPRDVMCHADYVYENDDMSARIASGSFAVDAMIVSQAADGASGAAWKLSTLIDPMTRPTADGSCDRCGAPAEALKDQYCAHCGRRVIREGR